MGQDVEIWNRSWKENPTKYSSEFGNYLPYFEPGKYGIDEILDVGCGSLLLSSVLEFVENLYVGIDISATALREAKEKRKNEAEFSSEGESRLTPLYEFAIASATHLPFRESSFPQVISSETIPHLGKDAYEALREITRCSKNRIAFTAIDYNIGEMSKKYLYEQLETGALFHIANKGEPAKCVLSLTEDETHKLLLELEFEPDKIEISTEPVFEERTKVKEINSRLFVKASKE